MILQEEITAKKILAPILLDRTQCLLSIFINSFPHVKIFKYQQQLKYSEYATQDP